MTGTAPISDGNHAAGKGSTFRTAHEKLLQHVQQRMRNGHFTERALARRLGISQSHINNVLHGRRNLSPDLADGILKLLNYSLFDLYARDSAAPPSSRIDPFTLTPHVPLLSDPVGPGFPWSTACDHARYRSPVPTDNPGCAAMVKLAADPRIFRGSQTPQMALLDLSVQARLADDPNALFVIERENETLVRWIRWGVGALYFADRYSLNDPLNWEVLRVSEEDRPDVLKAKVLWTGPRRLAQCC